MGRPKHSSPTQLMRNSARRTLQRLQTPISEVSKSGRAWAKAGRNPVNRFSKAVARQARRHPLAVTGIAAGLVILVGLAAGRRGRS